MDLIRDAMNAVQRNWQALLLYAGIIVVLSACITVANQYVDIPEEDPFGEPGLVAYGVVANLILMFGMALAQSVGFSRFGKDIDRPLWKISGDLEAIRRFLPLWVGLNAINFLTQILAGWYATAYGPSAFTNLLSLLALVVVMLYIPVGAALMFIKTSDWTHVVEAIRPLIRRYPKTLLVMVFTALLDRLQMFLLEGTQERVWLWPLVDLAFAYFECVIFSAVWLILMFDRQTPEEVNLDF